MHIKTGLSPDVVFAALAHPVRLEILALLAQGQGCLCSGNEMCVCEIAPHLERDRTVISRHLAILERAGILESRQEGRKVIYRIADPRVLQLIEIVQDMVKREDKR
ncbi:winged helix-turn-helix transcriptional regulator [candidate division WOR-3 bacterium]|nr:winged helix-turn-helix transcriptional regulator [candidate division WOR-3 bacterium]